MSKCEWRTRKRGTKRQRGSKFPVDDPSEGSYSRPPPATFHRRPKSVWERADEDTRKGQARYYERLEKHKAIKREENEIKMLIRLSQHPDPAKRFRARSEFKQKYPHAYAEFKREFAKGTIDTKDKSLFSKVFSTKIMEKKSEKEESQ